MQIFGLFVCVLMIIFVKCSVQTPPNYIYWVDTASWMNDFQRDSHGLLLFSNPMELQIFHPYAFSETFLEISSHLHGRWMTWLLAMINCQVPYEATQWNSCLSNPMELQIFHPHATSLKPSWKFPFEYDW